MVILQENNKNNQSQRAFLNINNRKKAVRRLFRTYQDELETEPYAGSLRSKLLCYVLDDD